MTDIRNDSLVNYSTSRKSFLLHLTARPSSFPREGSVSNSSVVVRGGKSIVISDTLCVVVERIHWEKVDRSNQFQWWEHRRRSNARSLYSSSFSNCIRDFLAYMLRIERYSVCKYLKNVSYILEHWFQEKKSQSQNSIQHFEFSRTFFSTGSWAIAARRAEWQAYQY